MGETAINWADHVWNPVVGCSVVSPGCTNCYAMKMAARLERMGLARYAGLTQPSKAGAVWTGKTRLVPEALPIPLRRRKPTIYFVNSMADLFHESVPEAWIDQVFAVMALASQHTFMVLTKRSARMRAYLSDPGLGRRIGAELMKAAEHHPGAAAIVVGIIHSLTVERKPLPNVWAGISAEDQEHADQRIPDLQATPAAVRWVSAEPLLGPIDFERIAYPSIRYETGIHYMDVLRGGFWSPQPFMRPSQPGEPKSYFTNHSDMKDSLIHLVIAGGESGHRARPMSTHWVRKIRDQCAGASVAFQLKQHGEYAPAPWKLAREEGETDDAYKARSEAQAATHAVSWGGYLNRLDHAPWSIERADREPESHAGVRRVGTKAAGRVLDGQIHDARPEVHHG